MINFNASLKWTLILIGIILLIWSGLTIGIYTAIFEPHPKIETVVHKVDTSAPEIPIVLSDTKLADNTVNLPEISVIMKENPQLDTLYQTTFKVDEEQYSGELETNFNLMSQKFGYYLKLKVQPESITVEVPVDVPVYVTQKNKFLSAYIGGGIGFGFENGDPVINYGSIKVGCVIKKTIPIYIQLDTNMVFSLNTGVIF